MELRALIATCQLLRRVAESEAVLPDLISAIAHNTRKLMQRNLIAQTVHCSKYATPERVVCSPCGRRLAWKAGDAIVVRDRQHGWQKTASLSAKYGKDICWSHDSSCICMAYITHKEEQGHLLLMDFSSGVVHHLAVGRAHDYNAPSVHWAPSACILASHPFISSASRKAQGGSETLCLVEASGQVTSVETFDFMKLDWAADSSRLVLLSGDGLFSIYHVATQQEHVDYLSCHGHWAWSPCTWHQPQLLVVGLNSSAHLLDAEGKHLGKCRTAIKYATEERDQDCMSYVGAIWGQHGVAVMNRQGLWLCEVVHNTSSFRLEVRDLLPGLGFWRTPKLAPDHQHLAFVLARHQSNSPQVLVVVDVVSGHQAVFEQANETYNWPGCQWSRQGFSITCSASTWGGPDRHYLRVLNFVF